MDITPESGVTSGLENIKLGGPRISSGIHLVPNHPPEPKPEPTPKYSDDSFEKLVQDIVDECLVEAEERLVVILSHRLLETEQVLLTKIAELHTHIDELQNNVWYKRFWNWMKGLFNAV